MPESTTDEEWSPYAPIRMRTTPAWEFAREAAKTGWVAPNGMVAANFYEHLHHGLIDPMLQVVFHQSKFGELQGMSGSALGTMIAKITSYEQWVPLIAQFESNGRQIFDLHDRLTELLVHTDVGEATLADLHTPYDAFFVRFGRQEQVKLEFDEGTYEYVDGAFVAVAPWNEHGPGRRLKVGFATVHKDGRQVGYPGLFFDILPEELLMPVPEAIESSLRRRLAKQADAPGDDANTLAFKSHVRAEIEDSAVLMRHCAALLFNALFYLESIEHHLPSPSPGRDTPPVLVAKWMSAPTKRHKLQSALTADGYAVVRLVGSEVDDVPRSTEIGHGGGAIKVHWRRGHWRMQPFGQQRASRRRIWIKPVLVGSDLASGPDATPGHIYVPPNTSDRVQ